MTTEGRYRQPRGEDMHVGRGGKDEAGNPGAGERLGRPGMIPDQR
jgi:hypothetical protein